MALEDLDFGHRLAIAIITVLIVLATLSATDYLAGAEPPAEVPQLYEGIPLDATLLLLDRRALEEAYHQQLLLIFSVWLKGDINEDQRARAGLKKARAAYNSAATQIAKREQELLERDRQQQKRSRP